MASVVYNGPSDSVSTPDGIEFPLGVPVEVDADLAASLERQGFSIVVKSEKGGK